MDKIAVSTDYLNSLSKLPAMIQHKANLMMRKFKYDSDSLGLNFEKIHGCKSDMRSVRVDLSYRAIVLKPKNSKVYLFLWADKHDDAYEWARRHQCQVHPETGSLQVFEPNYETLSPEKVPSTHKSISAFYELSDSQLARLGVPESVIPKVREVKNDQELNNIQLSLPREAYESLFLYLAGDSFDKIIKSFEKQKEPVDTEDIEAALKRRNSRSSFALIEDDIEFEKMLNAPLEQWRVFLHPIQRSLVERDWNGPVRVLGAAGTGKSVVAIHRAKWLAKQNLSSNNLHSQVLFVTFTKNLATDLKEKLRTICSLSELNQIKVVNLDSWVVDFLYRHKLRHPINFGGRYENEWRSSLESKPDDLNLPDTFYEQEWEDVIQANNIQNMRDYLRVSRVGRGKPLSVKWRRKVWIVFEEYIAKLAKIGVKEIVSAYWNALDLAKQPENRMKYTSIIVDEAQDISPIGFRLLRSLVEEGKNDMFIVGDSHQRIYNNRKIVLSHLGVNIVGRGRKLRLNYRTTKQTHDWAENLLKEHSFDDLDNGVDELTNIQSLTKGPSPTLQNFLNFEDQCNGIVEHVKQLESLEAELSSVCIVCRTKHELRRVRSHLIENNILTWLLKKDADSSLESDNKVRLATVHRVKGLEFDYIIIASCNQSFFPLETIMKDLGDDEVAKNAAEKLERSLLYVAATRAKKRVFVMSYGSSSPYLSTSDE